MRLWHKDLIPYLPDKQLLSQWRECCAIAKDISKKGKTNHILINRIGGYKISHFYKYCQLVADEMHHRGFETTNKSVEKIIAITDGFIRMEADCFITHDMLFSSWHDDRYLTQCYYNLQEKYDCGGIKESDWNKIEAFYKEVTNV